MTNETTVRVRYAETDQMGVVYHANYLIWMEIGRTNLLRQAGITYKELEEKGFLLPVIKAYAEYHIPAGYDDELKVLSTITRLSGPRIRIDYKIYRNPEELICDGMTEHAFLSAETRRVVRGPAWFIEKIILPDNPKDYQIKIAQE